MSNEKQLGNTPGKTIYMAMVKEKNQNPVKVYYPLTSCQLLQDLSLSLPWSADRIIPFLKYNLVCFKGNPHNVD